MALYRNRRADSGARSTIGHMASNAPLYIVGPAGDSLRSVASPTPRPLRWAAWNAVDGSYLLVGNGGTALRYLPDGKCEGIQTKTKHNLRGAAFASDGNEALLVGNQGIVLRHDVASGAIEHITSPTRENLRRVAYRPDGRMALIAGNAGTVLRYDHGSLVPVPGDRAHTLRAVSWKPDGSYALIGAYASAYAGYPRPHALYRCDGAYLQAALATEDEDDFVAVEWHPARSEALIAGYAYQGDDQVSNKLISYDGRGFRTQTVEASAALLGASWHPGGEYALLCGENGAMLRYRDGRPEQIESGVQDNLVGPFWSGDGSMALLLRGPSERVYTV
jgi:hypothetical protein